MDLVDFLKHVNSKKPVQGGSDMHQFMSQLSNEARRITAKINGSHHEPEEINQLFSELIGTPVDEGFWSVSAISYGLWKKYSYQQECIHKL